MSCPVTVANRFSTISVWWGRVPMHFLIIYVILVAKGCNYICAGLAILVHIFDAVIKNVHKSTQERNPT